MDGMNTCTFITSFAAIGLLLALAACSGPRDEQQTEDLPGLVDREVAGEGLEPAAAEPEAEDTVAPEATDGVADAPAGKLPAAVAPAPGVERPAMKNWMLIEFSAPVQEADLRWLEENGFRVDTLVGPTLVRGWLETAAGGEEIAKNPRVARIHAQMR